MRSKKFVTAIAVLVTLFAFWGPFSGTAQAAVLAPGSITTCGTLSTAGATYTLTADITLTTDGGCFGVTADDITLDGNGHTITGTGVSPHLNAITYRGVNLASTSGVTVKDLTVDMFNVGIFLSFTDGNTVFGNTLTNNTHSGIFFNRAHNDIITHNTVDSNVLAGIHDVNLSADNEVFNNNFISNGVFGGSGSFFNKPLPVGGNFWSSNAACDDLNGDGVCDLPYNFFSTHTDDFPLVSPVVWTGDTNPVTIDFEAESEGTAIDTEFTPVGATFSLQGGGAPIIGTEGGPLTGFVGLGGVNDFPARSGTNSLTPGAAAGPCPCLPPIEVYFSFPVSSLTLYTLDFDANLGDQLDLIAFDASGNEIGRTTIESLGFPGGDGAIQEMTVAGPRIRRVIVNYLGDSVHDNGLAIDDLTFVPGLGVGAAPPAPIFSDTFESRTTGTLFPDYTVLSGAVQVVSTTQKDGTQGNVLRLFSEDTVELTSVGDQSDFRFEFDLKAGLWDHVVSFRAVDLDNGYQFVFNNTSVSLYTVVGGTRTLLARGETLRPSANWERYTIEAVGGEIRVTDNEALLLRVTDDTYASGRFLFSAFVHARTLIDNLLIEATNESPTANAGQDQIVEWTGGSVTLDGSGSSDDDGDGLTYSWVFTTKPLGSTASLAGANTAAPSFTPDLLGDYVVELVVNDGTVDSAPDTVAITVEDTTAPTPLAALVAVATGGDDDDDDDEARYIVEYSCADACDANPEITAVIATPSLAGLDVKLKIKSRVKVVFDLEDGKVKIEGPDPAAIRDQIINLGGLAVDNGQEIKVEFDDDDEDEAVFKFDKNGVLKIEASSIQFLVTCEDSSGNVGTASAEVVPAPEEDDDDDEDDDDEGDDHDD